MLLGMVLLVIAAVGLLRLPDALSRQHAATKAATLALGVLLIGVGLKGGGLDWALRAGDLRGPAGHAAGGLAPAGPGRAARAGPRARLNAPFQAGV